MPSYIKADHFNTNLVHSVLQVYFCIFIENHIKMDLCSSNHAVRGSAVIHQPHDNQPNSYMQEMLILRIYFDYKNLPVQCLIPSDPCG